MIKTNHVVNITKIIDVISFLLTYESTKTMFYNSLI